MRKSLAQEAINLKSALNRKSRQELSVDLQEKLFRFERISQVQASTPLLILWFIKRKNL